MPERRAVAVLIAVAALGAAVPAGALDRFEIQVYDAELDAPGQLGLEMHLNYTFRGHRSPEYPGELPPDHVGRITFEPSVGVAEWLELGAYLQLLLAPGGDAQFGGVKGRGKLVLPERVRRRLGFPLFLGLNVEVSAVPHAVEPQRWASELRPIVGWRNGTWLVSFNPIIGYALSGPDRLRPELEPCAKVSWNTQHRFAIGAEYYAGLGPIDGLLPPREQEQLLFAVVDYAEPPRSPISGGRSGSTSPWEVNLALGAGLTAATGQHLVAKAIIGRSF